MKKILAVCLIMLILMSCITFVSYAADCEVYTIPIYPYSEMASFDVENWVITDPLAHIYYSRYRSVTGLNPPQAMETPIYNAIANTFNYCNTAIGEPGIMPTTATTLDLVAFPIYVNGCSSTTNKLQYDTRYLNFKTVVGYNSSYYDLNESGTLGSVNISGYNPEYTDIDGLFMVALFAVKDGGGDADGNAITSIKFESINNVNSANKNAVVGNNVMDVCISGLTVGAPNVQIKSEVDKYIIEQVSKYTSDDMLNSMNYVITSDYSDEVKFQVLNELFQNYGLTDAKEGVKYLSNASTHRMNYRYLTTDEIYCAYNFGNWLVNTTKGRFSRGLLYSSGLIFNFEKDEYLDILLGASTETPGTKKYKQMLIDFMSGSDYSVEVLENSKKTADFFQDIIKLNNLETDYQIENLMDQIIECNSKTEMKWLQKQFSTLLFKRIGDGKTLSFRSEKFADALGRSANIFSFISSTADDILSIINMEEQVELYEKYSYFLKTIFQYTDVAAEMRIAAKQLYDDMENGYYNKVQSILNNCIKLETGLLNISLLKGNVSDANMIIDFSTFIINGLIVDVGDFVRQASYTQGYAELSSLFCMILKNDAAAFKESNTAENAWKFFEDYNLLWRLRYKGEEQFLEMSSIKSIMGQIKAFNYDAKEKIVHNTLSKLNESKFEFTEYEIPKSVQYLSKSVMNCPVNVYVYTQQGELVAELIDGVESDITNEYGRFAVVYRSYTDEYAKVICQTSDEKLIIKAEAISDGLVNFETATVDDANTYTFDNVNITKGNIIKAENTSTYTIFNNESDEVGIQYNLNEIDQNTYVPVESITINNKTDITLRMGETFVLDTTILPANATNRSVTWISDDDNILTVDNGVVTGLREGTTTVYAYATDADEIVDSMEINVAPANLKLTIDSVSVDSLIGQLVVVGYKNGSIDKIEFIEGCESKISGYENSEYLKAFLWIDLKNMSPLCESDIFYVNSVR